MLTNIINFFQVISFLACLVAVGAARLPEVTTTENIDSHASYNFNYSVDDSITGDVKAQTETRDGDNVQGQYTLNDADGYKRIVDYSSDAVSGFKATVRRERLVAPSKLVVQQTIVPQSVVKVTPKKQIPKVFEPKATSVLVHHHHHQPATVNYVDPHTVHLVHTSPSAAIVKSVPTLITTTHHHTPAVVHHAPATVLHHAPALVKTSIGAPHHVSYVHYHH